MGTLEEDDSARTDVELFGLSGWVGKRLISLAGTVSSPV
jgi:hypothetical protein